MVVFYFSGTGNTKSVAELFSQKLNINCYSIEENVDFVQCINMNSTIVFCYPVYGSRVPRVMREFVTRIQDNLIDKNIIIFCTQFLFSGDGARAFVDLLPPGYGKVIYADHFFMPNNICGFFFLPILDKNNAQRYLPVTKTKIDHIVNDINHGVIKKRGFNVLSRFLGFIQGAVYPYLELKYRDKIKIKDNCSLCQYCISICPMHNLALSSNFIVQKGNCTLCHRCINSCPTKSIALISSNIKKQYKGLR